MDILGGRFLDENIGDLASSKYVQYNAEQKGITKSSPEEKIASWVDTTVGIHTKHRDNPQVMDRIKGYYHRQYVINPADVPESYFTNQQQQARELGYGHVEITERERKRAIDVIQKDQRQSLDLWIEYLNSSDSDYLPSWVKYWAFHGMLKLGRYNKETEEFEPRVKDTVSPFVEINSEALAYVLGTLQKKYGKEYFDLTDQISDKTITLNRAKRLSRQKRILELVDSQGANQLGKVIVVRDEKSGRVVNLKKGDIHGIRERVNTSEVFDIEAIKKEIKSLTTQRTNVLEVRGVPKEFSNIDSLDEDFGKLYAYAINEVIPITKSEREIIEGQWVKYEKGSNYKRLYDSLQGHGTGWCTAGGEETARGHLRGGDFYVYYSNDLNGNAVNPRIAIRMKGDRIAEIRGVDGNQEIDAQISISGVLEEKLKEFGDEGDRYKQKVEDMKRVTKIERKISQGIDLTKEDIKFIYESDRDIEGFGRGKDPRIGKILSKRDIEKDFAYLVDMSGLEYSSSLLIDYLIMVMIN